MLQALRAEESRREKMRRKKMRRKPRIAELLKAQGWWKP